MRYFLMFSLLLLFTSIKCLGNTIIIEIKTDESWVESDVNFTAYEIMGLQQGKEYQLIKNGSLWILAIPSNNPLSFYGSSRFDKLIGNSPFVLSPGDSIRFTISDKKISFSGTGSEAFALRNQLLNAAVAYKIDSISRMAYDVNTVQNYFFMMRMLFDYQKHCLNIIDGFKNRLSPSCITYYKASVQPLRQMGYGMMSLVQHSRKKKLKLSNAELSSIYDSVINEYGNFFLTPIDTFGVTPSASTLGGNFVRVAYLRSKKFQLNTEEDSLDKRNHNWAAIYYFAKNYYTGLARERALFNIVTFRLIQEGDASFEELSAIRDFLSLPGYPEMREQVSTVFKRKRGYSLENISPSMFADGPYILYKMGVVEVKSVLLDNNSVSPKSSASKKKPVTIKVNPSDKSRSFDVVIKKNLMPESTEYGRPNKIFVISDIEGNYTVFKSLLLNSKIINQNLNWTFGNNSLVLVGDFMDRGHEVTEVLWLIYSLEQKAEAKGGKVHFILGNHEIMNLSNSIKYLHFKYKHNSRLLKENYASDLYGENSELGRWLRTKNIAEKIGDLLFTHAGISPQVNNLSLSLVEINDRARKFYPISDSANSQSNLVVKTLYNSYTSPFWYRHYYKKDHFSKSQNTLYYKATEGQLDSTLQKFAVRRIITGHTIVADTISVHYGGKVINTDTKHAEGKSEALLIEGNKYYRVNGEGRRVLLFMDSRKKIQ